MTKQTQCPICGSQYLYEFLKREDVPVHQNMVFQSAELARSIQCGALTMCVCKTCGFVFNATYEPQLLKYDETYDNTQTHSEAFQNHVNELTTYLREQHNADHSQIVEVGCGKGHFLRRLVNKSNQSVGYGFDPTYEGALTDLDGRLQFVRTFYDEQSAATPADIVVCRHVIEHVPNPLALLKSIRAALVHSPNARVFFETPCAEWIFRNQVIWDFFYEHCSIFTRESLANAFELSGFEVTNVKYVFGGQYLWLEAIPKNQASAGATQSDLHYLAETYAAAEKHLLAKWKTGISKLRQTGNIALWGAGAKGATLAFLADRAASQISCVVDLNPKKQGCFLPATGHPIIAYQDLNQYNVRYVFSMNPNYQEENQKLLDALSSKVELLNYLS